MHIFFQGKNMKIIPNQWEDNTEYSAHNFYEITFYAMY